VKPVLDALQARYPDLNLTRLEVYNNADNRERLTELSRASGVQNPGVPIIFIGKDVLIGDSEITSRFESEIVTERERIASCNTTVPVNPPPREPTCAPATPPFSLPLVIFAALIDSTNPCGLSVLVFLLISMAAAGDKKRILLVGGAYIAAMFLFHLLVGIGLFSVFSLSGLAKLFSLIGGAVALILGLITIIDVLRNRETYLLSIPESGKGLLGNYIRMASLPAAFILGILAGILGFTCTGGIYISILGLMGRDMTVMTGLPWLILYNLVYILPLVILTILVAYGISPERADRLRTEYKRPLRLIIGGILIALGAVILLGWLG
jgi:cytochrome c biogenesis protein CcdA